MHHRLATAIATVLLAACGACGPNAFRVCNPPSAAALDRLPRRLSETGLYADLARDQIAEGVLPFAPRYQLWSDGAKKRRWVHLPPGSKIDTADMDSWLFPEGTKLWKEFTRDGVRVETRLLYKFGPAPEDWVGAAYVWGASGADAVLEPAGWVDAGGTPHDVPAAAECMGCHGGRKSRVLGLSAIQLSHDAEPGHVALADLAAAGRLSHAPQGRYEVPGTETQRDALGYLHANCGHCHNQARPGPSEPRCFAPENPLDFWLRTDALLAVEQTPTYRSAIGVDVEPGAPESSAMIRRMQSRGNPYFAGMPPLATEKVDDHAVALLRRWIAEMRR